MKKSFTLLLASTFTLLFMSCASIDESRGEKKVLENASVSQDMMWERHIQNRENTGASFRR